MSLSRLFRFGFILVAAYFLLKFMGMTPSDLWQAITGKVDAFKQDTQQLATGKTVQQVSEKMRSEMKAAQEASPIVADKEMSRELQAERARMLEAKFDALQKVNIIPTEQGKLGEQVVKNAQMAGGGN